MITLQGKLPYPVVVATSGGVDSMAVVDFLSRNHRVIMHFVHHGTRTSEDACQFLKKYSEKTGTALTIDYIIKEKPADESQEEFWRNERYRFFRTWELSDYPVITCHHLDDCMETWVYSSLNGEGKIIPYRNQNVIRPFRQTRKSDFVRWCKKHNVEWVEDGSNFDTKYMRNYVRHNIMPHALKVNKGLPKVIRKKVKEDYVN